MSTRRSIQNATPPKGISLCLQLDVPSPQETSEAESVPSVEDKVRSALDLIDSGYHSNVQWLTVNKLYKQLQDMPKKSKRVQNLIDMIEPVLAKYGYHGVSSKG